MLALLLAGVVATILLLLAALHAYWAAGGQAGAGAVVPTRPAATDRTDGAGGGTPLFAPGPAATLAVAVALTLAAGLVLGRAGAVPRLGPAWVYRYGAWALGAVFLLRSVGEFRYVGLFKQVRGTHFATLDTRLYTPLCAGLAAAVLYLAAV